MGTGRGENVIFAQEQSVKMIEQADYVDEIVFSSEPVLSSINASVSDFPTAIELDKKAEEITESYAWRNPGVSPGC